MTRAALVLVFAAFTVGCAGRTSFDDSLIEGDSTWSEGESSAQAQARYAEAAAYAQAHNGVALLVISGTDVVFEWTADTYDPAIPRHLFSGTKSFSCAVADLLVDDGVLDLDAPVVDTIPELGAGSAVTARHLLNFTSSIEQRMWALTIDGLSEEQLVRDKYQYAVELPSQWEPGSKFEYGSSHLIVFGALVQRLTGRDALQILEDRVFAPLDFKVGGWHRDLTGNPMLPYGAWTTAREWAKYGVLLRDDGMWEGSCQPGCALGAPLPVTPIPPMPRPGGSMPPSARTRSSPTSDSWRPISEGRFGLRQALREWPDNQAASTVLRNATESMARFELATDHTDAAGQLLHEMDSPDPELESQLNTAIHTEEVRPGELHAVERRHNPATGQRVRLIVTGAAGLMFTAVPLLRHQLEFEVATAHNTERAAMLGFVVALSTLGWVFRDRLGESRINTNAFMLVWLAPASAIIVNVGAQGLGMSGIDAITIEIGTWSAIAAMGAFVIDRGIGVIALAFVVGFIHNAWGLTLVFLALASINLVMTVTLVYLWGREEGLSDSV